jgi:hypothetical protein
LSWRWSAATLYSSFITFGLFALRQLFFVVRRLPGLIAAFRLVSADDDEQAERASKALEVIEPRWHWKWQRRG